MITDNKMPNLLISVVIPTYNAMPHLIDCLESILNQTYHYLQVIVVNDGSSDETAEYLASVTDNRLIVISVENGGVSAARNIGLRKCLGDYITFVDSDDRVEPWFVDNALRFAINNNLDMAVGGLTKDYGSRQVLLGTRTGDNAGKSAIYKGEEIQRVIEKVIAYSVPGDSFLSSFFMSGSVCKLIRKPIIDGIGFDPEISIGEDTLFNVSLLSRCSRVGFVATNWYNYSIRRDSALGSYKPDAIEESELLLSKLRQSLPDSMDNESWPPYLVARGLRRFEGAYVQSMPYADNRITITSMRTDLGKILSRSFWDSLFSDSNRWLPYIRGFRYRVLGRLCANKCLGALSLYFKLLNSINGMRKR